VVFLASSGIDKTSIRDDIEQRFGYDLHHVTATIRPAYTFDVTCQDSISEKIISFIGTENIDEAIGLAISLGGDADTLACMAGAVAQAYYREVPGALVELVKNKLTPELWAFAEAICVCYGVVEGRSEGVR